MRSFATLTNPRESALEVPGSHHGPFGRKELLIFRTDHGAADGPRFTPGLVSRRRMFLLGGYKVSGSYCTGSVPSRASRKYRAKFRSRLAIQATRSISG